MVDVAGSIVSGSPVSAACSVPPAVGAPVAGAATVPEVVVVPLVHAASTAPRLVAPSAKVLKPAARAMNERREMLPVRKLRARRSARCSSSLRCMFPPLFRSAVLAEPSQVCAVEVCWVLPHRCVASLRRRPIRPREALVQLLRERDGDQDVLLTCHHQ